MGYNTDWNGSLKTSRPFTRIELDTWNERHWLKKGTIVNTTMALLTENFLRYGVISISETHLMVVFLNGMKVRRHTKVSDG